MPCKKLRGIYLESSLLVIYTGCKFAFEIWTALITEHPVIKSLFKQKIGENI